MAGMTEARATPHPGGIAERSPPCAAGSPRPRGRRQGPASSGDRRHQDRAPERIAEASRGVTEIGENRVQEARLSTPAVAFRPSAGTCSVTPRAISAARRSALRHGALLDSERLALALGSHRDPARDPSCPGRGGLHRHRGRSGIPLRLPCRLLRGVRAARSEAAGLMTIAPFGDLTAAAQCFRSHP